MTPGDRRRPQWSAAITGVLVLVLCAAPTGCGRPEGALPRPASPPALLENAEEQAPDPVRIRIPAIGVDAPVEPLEVDKTGVLPAPTTNEGTGWWRAGPEPGERGPAVIAGHVDSFRGPAVFFRLTDIKPGDDIFIDRRDGSTVVFAAARIEQHNKNSFPTQSVYGATPDSQLRLITCGGQFDHTARRYLDNIIVYAFRIR